MTINLKQAIGLVIIIGVVVYWFGGYDFQKKSCPASDGIVSSAKEMKTLNADLPSERAPFCSEQDLENPEPVHPRPRPVNANRLAFVNDTKNFWVEIREGSKLRFNMKPHEPYDLYCGFAVPITLTVYKLNGNDRKVVLMTSGLQTFKKERDRYGRPPPFEWKPITIRDSEKGSLNPVEIDGFHEGFCPSRN